MPQVEIVSSPEIWHRDDMPLLCNWRKLFRAVEIGVDHALWASLFLDRWQGHQWWGVDAYEPYPEMNYERESDYRMALGNLQRHSHRAKLIRGYSMVVARAFPPDSVDFLYIDGAHDYDSVIGDIRAWWHTLSPAGILAGHDWTEQPLHEGVKRAVAEFAESINQTVYLTSVEGYGQEVCPSWFLYKSGMPGADWRRC